MGGSASNFSVNTDWRLPISHALVNGGSDANLLASSTARTFPAVTVPINSTDYLISYRFSTPVAAPGGIFWWRYGAGPTVTFTAESSVDTTNGTDGNWTSVTYTPQVPNATTSTADRGQVIIIPTGAIGFRLKTTNTVASLTITPGVFQLNSNPAKNDLILGVGMSITVNTYTTAWVVERELSFRAGISEQAPRYRVCNALNPVTRAKNSHAHRAARSGADARRDVDGLCALVDAGNHGVCWDACAINDIADC